MKNTASRKKRSSALSRAMLLRPVLVSVQQFTAQRRVRGDTYDAWVMTPAWRARWFHRRLLMLQDDVSDAVRQMRRRPGTIFVDSLHVDVLNRWQGTSCCCRRRRRWWHRWCHRQMMRRRLRRLSIERIGNELRQPLHSDFRFDLRPSQPGSVS